MKPLKNKAETPNKDENRFSEKSASEDLRTESGYYREEVTFRGNVRTTQRLYCGDADCAWTELTGDPWQSDVEDEIARALCGEVS